MLDTETARFNPNRDCLPDIQNRHEQNAVSVSASLAHSHGTQGDFSVSICLAAMLRQVEMIREDSERASENEVGARRRNKVIT